MQKDSQAAAVQRQQNLSLLIKGMALCLGATVALFGYIAASKGVSKIVEELVAVNETVHGNAEQFSLVPYAEDPDEFRESIDMWRGYLREICNMATNAVVGPLEDDAQLSLLGNAIIYAFFFQVPLIFFSSQLAATALAFLLPPVLAAAASCAKLLMAMAWVNQGLMYVVRDLRVGAMEKLLAGSNQNDDFLQAMLLATGHLTNIDESPFWLCVPLPWPFDVRLPAVMAASHGGAWTDGCLCVTWLVLTWLSGASAVLLVIGVWRVVATQGAAPTPKATRVRILE